MQWVAISLIELKLDWFNQVPSILNDVQIKCKFVLSNQNLINKIWNGVNFSVSLNSGYVTWIRWSEILKILMKLARKKIDKGKVSE